MMDYPQFNRFLDLKSILLLISISRSHPNLIVLHVQQSLFPSQPPLIKLIPKKEKRKHHQPHLRTAQTWKLLRLY